MGRRDAAASQSVTKAAPGFKSSASYSVKHKENL
jgi:hypothetical protein